MQHVSDTNGLFNKVAEGTDGTEKILQKQNKAMVVERKTEVDEATSPENAIISWADYEECEKGAMRDAGIILAGQKVEHYEIATYGTLRQFAETLGLGDAESLLLKSLDEEKAADEKLTEVAVSAVNIEAAG